MKTKRICKAAAACIALIILSGMRLLPFSADTVPETAAEIAFALSGGDMQGWIDGTLTPSAGESVPDFCIMALAQQGGYDLSGYADAMAHTVPAMTNAVSASSKERAALAWIAAAGEVPEACTALLDTNAEALGLMSRVFALHLVSNGVRSQKYHADTLIQMILPLQCADGGWTVFGAYGDPDVTAMVLQALAPHRDSKAVDDAKTRAFAFLSERQLPSGGYASYGTENPESAAQVWIALSAWGVPLRDGRFVKDGHTVADGIAKFRVSAGKYAHTEGGAESALATEQVYLALTAAQLAKPLYLFCDAAPELPPEHIETTVSASVFTLQTTASVTGSLPLVTQPTAALPADTTVPAGTTVSADSTLSDTVRTTASYTETTVSASFSTGSSHGTLATSLLTTAPPEQTAGTRYPYRLPLTGAAFLVFGVAAAVCILRKKRSAKTYLTIAFGFAAAAACIWLIRIESPDDFYRTSEKNGGTVTMEIRCDVICGLAGSERFPSDGVMMQNTEFTIDAGENALTLLYDAVKAYRLQIEVDGISGDVVETAYVRGIGSLYEMDFGDLSGWTYTVNGVRPAVGCGAYTLHDGDAVAWIYTINL